MPKKVEVIKQEEPVGKLRGKAKSTDKPPAPKLTRAERETIITTNEEKEEWDIFTYSQALQTKINAKIKSDPSCGKCIESNSLGGKRYILNYDAFRVGVKNKRECKLSDEQRAAISERMKGRKSTD